MQPGRVDPSRQGGGAGTANSALVLGSSVAAGPHRKSQQLINAWLWSTKDPFDGTLDLCRKLIFAAQLVLGGGSSFRIAPSK